MKTYLECMPCFLRQSLEAARGAGINEESTMGLLKEVMLLMLDVNWNSPPPLMGRTIHRMVRKVCNSDDPYQERKLADTQVALKLLDEMEEMVRSSSDSFSTAVRLSIAGNAIDLGASSGDETEVEAAFHRSFHETIDKDALRKLVSNIAAADNILFLADNAGEIVFDIPLLTLIGSKKVTVTVRGAPCINDATLDDAARSGISDKFRTIDNGCDIPGTVLEECSDNFIREFEKADLVLAKGQGNYETLSDSDKPIIFLFLAKCPVIARHADVPLRTYTIKATHF